MKNFPHFANQPLRDFGLPHARSEYEHALGAISEKIAAKKLTAYPIIDGVPVHSAELLERTDPSNSTILVGRTHAATVEQAGRAIASVKRGFSSWSERSYSERSSVLRNAARLMKERSAALAALIIREAGKPWREADGDVAEAIDFCAYYADEVDRMWEPRLTDQVLGEENTYFYQPRGVVAVISPWNFPLAITCGMTVAALATGNTVVLKPAEQASLIAYELAQILFEAGVPGDALAFLPGRGETVGRFLVNHPDVAMIAFTGSRAVGLEIISAAAQITPGQRGIKRVVAELGGKNAIIIDEDADSDDAVRGILTSAFGFAGQKCSACSRLIVVGASYEPLLERLSNAVRDIIVGSAADPASFLGPVIDQESQARIRATIAAAHDLKLAAQSPLPESLTAQGYFVPPTIFRDVPRGHSLWRDEIFGPVLACAQATSFEAALEMAVDSDYALTGGVFSRHPHNIALAKQRFKVGNLYINRSITGALVGRQPFGGFCFSGIGSKAGGPDYLLQFTEPRVVTENTMRRGFSPDLNN